MKYKHTIFLLGIFIITLYSCSKKEEPFYPEPIVLDDGNPTPYNFITPQGFPQPFLPSSNPLTVEGIELGRRLFYEPLLSGDGTQACADCHSLSFALVDSNKQFSTGITGAIGNRNSMPLFNLAWNFNNKFFWDGRAISLEEQGFAPVTNPIEMNNTWPNAVASLQAHPTYPNLFNKAFGTSVIDSVLVVKAIAQFEHTLISSDSKFDRYLKGQQALTPAEIRGFDLFTHDRNVPFQTGGADCFHCHGSAGNLLMTDNDFHNNGLDSTFTDLGLGLITGFSYDNGKFKTPSLRNLSFTAPYMHDGRFTTLDEVIDHYSEGLVHSSTIDPLMKNVSYGGVQLNPSEKADLKAFLLTLDDYTFITNPKFQKPTP